MKSSQGIILSAKRAFRAFSRIRTKYTRPIDKNNRTLGGLIAYNEYGGYLTPISSHRRPAVKKILKGKVFEPKSIVFMRENCGSGDIIHAGAFFGDFLPGLSDALSHGAELWAFEPNPENFRCAEITVLINDLKNVRLFNYGLGAESMTAKMQIESEFGVSLGGGSMMVEDKITNGTVDVRIEKIDDIIPEERTVSILHLDVEGYEKEALAGAMKTIKRNKPILLLEDSKNAIESEWFAKNILSLGYEIKGKIHANTLLKVTKTN